MSTTPHPPRTPKGKRTASHGQEVARPESTSADSTYSRMDTPGVDARMVSPSEDGLNPLQVAGRKSPPDQEEFRDSSGFSKLKGARVINTPTAPIHVDRRFWPRDMRGLLEIYEQGHELQQGMKSHCKETTNAMEMLAGHCDNTVKQLMQEMQQILQHIQEQVEKPANVDWTPVHSSLHKIDLLQPGAIGAEVTNRLNDHQEIMFQLERRMDEKMAARIQSVESSALDREKAQNEELDKLRNEVKHSQHLSKDIEKGVKHIEGSLVDTLGNQHRALKADFSQTLQDIMRLQEKNRRIDMATVEPALEAQLKRILSEHHQSLQANVADNVDQVLKTQEQQGKVVADFKPFLSSQLHSEFEHSRRLNDEQKSNVKDIHRIVNDDVSQLFNEIGTIQRAMNLDYIAKPKTRKTVKESSSQRFREFMTQTDFNSTRDGHCQTDAAYFKDLKKKEEKQKLLKSKSKPKLSTAVAANQLKDAPQRKRSNFGASEAKKQKMREALIKPSYDVANFYYSTGCMQSIARSSNFENATFLVILLNALWIAIDTDYNDAVVLIDADRVFFITENLFCSYFTFELLIRIGSFRNKRDCVRDKSIVFDSVLLTGMIIETWVITVILLAMGSSSGSYAAGLGNFSILRMARLVKMLRMARMARLLRMVPELVVIVKSIGVAFRSVGFFLLLMVIILYVFAVFFRSVTKDTPIGKQYFDNVLIAMNSLLLDGVLPLYARLIRDVSEANILFWPLMIIFILLASVTVMNMLVGVLVEVVRVVAERERESMTVIHVTNELREVMHNFMQDQNEGERLSGKRTSVVGLIKVGSMVRGHRKSQEVQNWKNADIPDMSKENFEMFLGSPPVVHLLRDCGVDAIGILDSMEMIFEEKVIDGQEGLSFIDFVEVVLNMRGTNPATVKDVKEQVRLLKAGTTESFRMTDKKVTDQLASFRKDMNVQLAELRKSIDSDAGSDEEGTGHLTLNYGSRNSYSGDGDNQDRRRGSQGSYSGQNSPRNPGNRNSRGMESWASADVSTTARRGSPEEDENSDNSSKGFSGGESQATGMLVPNIDDVEDLA